MAVLYGLPGTPGADSIPFPIAIALSVAFFITAVIRLGGYFLPRSHQPLQLTVSIISLMASGLLLGFVSSGNDSHWCQVTYICSLFANIAIVGIYEVEVCWQINTIIFPQLQQVLLALGILNISLNIGLCVWFGNCNKDLPSILVILLCSSCILYSVASFSYFKLFFCGQTPYVHLLGSGISCVLTIVLIVIFSGVGGANQIPGGLISSTWIALAVSSVLTLRIPYRRWRNRDLLFQCRGNSEEALVMYP